MRPDCFVISIIVFFREGKKKTFFEEEEWKSLRNKRLIAIIIFRIKSCICFLIGPSFSRGTDAEPGAPAMGAKSLCSPFDQPRAITKDMKCIHPDCSRKPEKFTLFGRSY